MTDLSLQKEIDNYISKINYYIDINDKITKENTELIKKAKKSEALQKLVESLIKDRTYYMYLHSNEHLDYGNENFSHIDALNKRIHELTIERDDLVKEVGKSDFIKKEISKKNEEISSLNRELAESRSIIAHYRTLETSRYNKDEDENVIDNSDFNIIQNQNQRLLEHQKKLYQEIADLKVKNQELERKLEHSNSELEKERMMSKMQSVENHILTMDKFKIDNSYIDSVITHHSRKLIVNISKRLDYFDNKIAHLNKKLSTSMNPNNNDEVEELREIIEELNEKIADFEENDYAPKYNVSLIKIKELEEQIRRLT